MQTLSEIFNGKIPGMKNKVNTELGPNVVNKILTHSPNTYPKNKVPSVGLNMKPTSKSPFGSMDNKIYGSVKRDLNFNLTPKIPNTRINQKANMGFNMVKDYKQDFFNKANMRPDLSANHRMQQQRGLSLFGDRDGDGLPNIFDCDPLDKNKQGRVHDFFSGIGKGIKKGAHYVEEKFEEGVDYVDSKVKSVVTAGADEVPMDYLERYEEEPEEGVSEYSTKTSLGGKVSKVKTYNTTIEDEPEDTYDLKSKIQGSQDFSVRYGMGAPSAPVGVEGVKIDATPEAEKKDTLVTRFLRGVNVYPSKQEEEDLKFRSDIRKEVKKEIIDEVRQGKFKGNLLGTFTQPNWRYYDYGKQPKGTKTAGRPYYGGPTGSPAPSQYPDALLLDALSNQSRSRASDIMGGMKAGLSGLASFVKPQTVESGFSMKGGQPQRLTKMSEIATPPTKFKSQVIRALGKKEEIEKLESQEKREKAQEELLKHQLMMQSLYPQQVQAGVVAQGVVAGTTKGIVDNPLVPDTPPPGMPPTIVENGVTKIWSNRTNKYVVRKRGGYGKRKIPQLVQQQYEAT